MEVVFTANTCSRHTKSISYCTLINMLWFTSIGNEWATVSVSYTKQVRVSSAVYVGHTVLFGSSMMQANLWRNAIIQPMFVGPLNTRNGIIWLGLLKSPNDGWKLTNGNKSLRKFVKLLWIVFSIIQMQLFKIFVQTTQICAKNIHNSLLAPGLYADSLDTKLWECAFMQTCTNIYIHTFVLQWNGTVTPLFKIKSVNDVHWLLRDTKSGLYQSVFHASRLLPRPW